MSNLILHPQTKLHVAQYLGHPSHALLLIGDRGTGKTALATTIASDVLGIPEEKLEVYPYFTIIRPGDGAISIEAIRELQHFLQLKTLGTKDLRRIVIVEHAEQMGIEAQNAYLKLLEEPPADTVMILTVNNKRSLLPTILSRVQTITIHAPSEEEIKNFFSGLGSETVIVNQAYFLSGGLPGLMHSLIQGDEKHPLMQGVTLAKEVLQKKVFERLILVDKLSKKKEEAASMLEALQHIAQTGIDLAAKKGDSAKLKQWHHILQVTHESSEALKKNANTKLVLCNTMLRI